jgi:hypothetical protein
MLTQSSSSRFHEYQCSVIFLNVASMKFSSSHCMHTFRKVMFAKSVTGTSSYLQILNLIQLFENMGNRYH